jgi:hypothetical protein
VTASEIVDASKCYQCFGLTDWSAAVVYLLAAATGNTMTAAQLAEVSKCYQCIPDFVASEVYLINRTIS